MNRSHVVGTVLVVVLIAAMIVVVASISDTPGSDPKSCVYPTADYVMAPELRYRLRPFPASPSPEEFQYYDYNPQLPGRPLVVLVAGYPEPHYFDAVLAQMKDAKYRVLVLDLPGKGHTRLSGTPTAAYIVDRFERLWNQLRPETEKGFLIVGTSIGSPVAALMAARWHEQRPRLALVSALGMPRAWSDWRHPFVVNTGRIPVLSDLLAPFVLPWLTRDSWQHGEILRSDHFPELFERQRQEFMGPYSAINYLELTKALVLTNQTPVYKLVERASIPVWLINGEKDPFADQIDKLKTVLTHPIEKRIDCAAHIPFIEQPDETFDFLKGLVGGASSRGIR